MSTPTQPEVKIWDGTTPVAVGTSAPAGTEAGLITRNIPSGTQTVSVTGTATVAGAVTATPVVAATSAVTQVASSATSATVLAANANRFGASFYNDSTQTLYLKFGTTASATSYTVKMPPDSYFEVPSRYTGRIDGIWASANGFAYVTELTA